MEPLLDWSGLEIIDFEKCRELLHACRVARLGFVDHGGPVVLPVNYAMDGNGAVFRTSRGSKLSAAVMGNPVCLEIDEFDVVEHRGWSVVAKGMARHVVDADEIERLDRLPLRPWARPDLRPHWVRVMIEEVTGRRIRPGWFAGREHAL